MVQRLHKQNDYDTIYDSDSPIQSPCLLSLSRWKKINKVMWSKIGVCEGKQ